MGARCNLFFLSVTLAFSATADITILGVGDILMHQSLQTQAKKSADGFHSLWSQVAALISEANIAYGNIEGPMADGLAPQTKKMVFNFPGFLAGQLKEVGFDIVSTANNHSLDRGKEGLFRTIKTLKAAQLNFVGTREDINSNEGFFRFISVGGVKTAWIACADEKNSGYSPHVADCEIHQEYLGQLIKTMKEQKAADIVVVTPHWGNEYSEEPSDRQISLAKYFFNKGADLIFGAHTHSMHRADMYNLTDELGETKRRLVFYSLGNFVSNQSGMGIPNGSTILARAKIGEANGKVQVLDYDAVPLRMFRYPHFLSVIKDKNSDHYMYLYKKGYKFRQGY